MIRSGTYYFPQRIHFRATWRAVVAPNSFVIDFAPIGGRRRMKFQPHKLKPLLMASSPEQKTRPYPGEIIRRCTRIDSARRRNCTSLWTLWRTLNAVKRTDSEKRPWPARRAENSREEFIIIRHDGRLSTSYMRTTIARILHYYYVFERNVEKLRRKHQYISHKIKIMLYKSNNFRICARLCAFIYTFIVYIHGLNLPYRELSTFAMLNASLQF